jgi:signal transduction histidine kinase
VEELALPPLARAVHAAIEHHETVAPEGDAELVALRVGRGERCYRLRTAPILRQSDGVAGTVTVLEDVTRERELDAMKDEFISIASHELRTPLGALEMAVHLLAEGSAGALNPKQQRLVRMALDNAERLDRLARDLLDLARLEAGADVPERRPLAPRDVAEAGTAPLRSAAEEKGISLELSADPSLPMISGDLSQLSRAVSNLVANAIRHTPAGGRIEVVAVEEEGRVRFAVSDTGEGIAPEYLPHIFERFAQVPGATSGGAGLGLPIARRIVEVHDGEMDVESTVGRGSTFSFTVPVG